MALPNKLKKQIEKYALLSVKKGINVQKNQTVTLYSSVEPDSVEFTRLQAKFAYELGAKQVNIEWRDPISNKMFIENASEETLSLIPKWFKDKWEELIRVEKTSRLSTIGDDPDLMKGVSAKKQKIRTDALQNNTKIVREATMNDDISWLVNAAPTKEWAEKVFPDLKGDAAIEKLWEAILKTVYVSENNNPEEIWDEHITTLGEKAKWLNKNNFSYLHFKSPITDIKIGLAKNHNWEAALSKDKNGNYFIANMPTEEVFTSPDFRNINGIVTSTKPLNYQGTLIENLKLEFKDGKIIKNSSTSGQEILESLIDTDNGSHSLGEISLVPNSSPISQSGITWFETLFDENASSHIAIGASYTSTIKNGKNLSKKELDVLGWNDSTVHVDFMIGDEHTDVTGYKENGEEVKIFVNGEWV